MITLNTVLDAIAKEQDTAQVLEVAIAHLISWKSQVNNRINRIRNANVGTELASEVGAKMIANLQVELDNIRLMMVELNELENIYFGCDEESNAESYEDFADFDPAIHVGSDDEVESLLIYTGDR